MEMLLVLAVLVMVAAIVAPAFNGAMKRATLTRAGDSVRVVFTQAHVKAMKTGRIQVVYYELNGRKYRMQPWIAGDDELEAGMDTLGTGAEQGIGMIDSGESPADTGEERELPEGTSFVGGEAGEESRGAVVAAEVDSQGGMEGEWSRPILFYPDGSSSDAFVVVGDEEERGMRITLSGLTGTAKISPVTAVDQLIEP